jgi:hypothetical protein
MGDTPKSGGERILSDAAKNVLARPGPTLRGNHKDKVVGINNCNLCLECFQPEWGVRADPGGLTVRVIRRLQGGKSEYVANYFIRATALDCPNHSPLVVAAG